MSARLNKSEYSDDPVEIKDKFRFISKKFIAIGILTIFTLVIGNTLASNIKINKGEKVEFGQAVASLTSCAGSNPIELIPKATFLNASLSGSFYFREATF